MTERAIILRADEVRAFLDGRQSQIRRPVQPQPRGILGPLTWEQGPSGRGPEWWSACEGRIRCAFLNRCPFGAPGDTLCVKETFRYYGEDNSARFLEFAADYDETERRLVAWKPASNLPRRLSRITLKVISVRVERAGAITWDDVIESGCPDRGLPDDNPMDWFRETWDSIYAKRGYGWDENPWTWVGRVEVTHG